MKYLPLLGVLFLYANPVVAGDFVYVKCDAKLLTKVIDPETSDALDSFPESDTKVYKIDSKNSTIKNKDSFSHHIATRLSALKQAKDKSRITPMTKAVDSWR